MNDTLIRESFHRQRLWRLRASPNTIVIDELGLKHGKCRADIAVINGYLAGYEIKSDEDSLSRLEQQVEVYGAVFDRATAVVGTKHARSIRSAIPRWWGIVVCDLKAKGRIVFETVRDAQQNRHVDPFAVAQLLWSDEASSILNSLGEPPTILRLKRSLLYERLTDLLTLAELRREVTVCLKKRKSWRRL